MLNNAAISAAIMRGSMPLAGCVAVGVEEVAVAIGDENCAIIFGVAAETLVGIKLRRTQSKIRRIIDAITDTIAGIILRCIVLSLMQKSDCQ